MDWRKHRKLFYWKYSMLEQKGNFIMTIRKMDYNLLMCPNETGSPQYSWLGRLHDHLFHMEINSTSFCRNVFSKIIWIYPKLLIWKKIDNYFLHLSLTWQLQFSSELNILFLVFSQYLSYKKQIKLDKRNFIIL